MSLFKKHYLGTRDYKIIIDWKKTGKKDKYINFNNIFINFSILYIRGETRFFFFLNNVTVSNYKKDVPEIIF